MSLSYQYIEKIASLAREVVLGRYNNDYSNPRPVDLNEDIKTSLGIRILYTDSVEFDGCVRWNDRLNRPEIVISRHRPLTRQEFTILHEVGHLLLHWKWLPNKGMQPDAREYAAKQANVLDLVPLYRGKTSREEDPKEKEANEFASDFLMPAKGVRKYYDGVYDSKLNDEQNADNVKLNLGNQFRVSEGAAFERIRNMQHNGEL